MNNKELYQWVYDNIPGYGQRSKNHCPGLRTYSYYSQWIKKKAGGRNEALDCRVYAMAALEIINIDLSTARGLAYYTGTVFECFDKFEKFRAIAGGGRYDNMVEQFKGEPCPATGFGLGYATLSLLLKEKKRVVLIVPKSARKPVWEAKLKKYVRIK